MKRALTVWWDGRIAGALSLDPHGDMSFAYDANWLADAGCPALSASLPKQLQPFNRRQTRPFFSGLLPEEAQREAVARALGISKGNDFALLSALGGDVAGALTLWPEGETPPAVEQQAGEPLGDNALIDLLNTLPERPFLAGRQGLRLSLAGAQSKLPVVLLGGRTALPGPGQPTTHILKPPIERFPATTENEAFAMKLAAAIGLDVAPVETRKVSGRPFLLVTRYDRFMDDTGRAHRLHQEDFCQALALPPEHKYAVEGGPTFKTSFELLRKAATRPAVEVLKLLDAAIFNLVLGNADAHGKNFSILYGQDGVVLAPLYDLMCTVAYPGITPRLAMKIGGADRLEKVTPRAWEKFAAETGLGLPFVRRRVAELAEKIIAKAAPAASEIALAGLDTAALAQFGSIVRQRAGQVSASAGQS